ncbi:MAG: TIGR00289 family protein [Candidatus Diapherotrites archaeon]|nr:TIGR00289 family protein [Candidatus Diapherotrites archaeon]
MRLLALYSGGKDSCYAIYLAQKQSHKIVNMFAMVSESDASYMYHVPNIGLTVLGARAMNIPLELVPTKGEKEKEVDDLERALKSVKVDGLLTGAVKSNYQMSRVEKICEKLSLEAVAPLWQKNEDELLQAMLDAGFEIIIVGVAAEGLDESWLGRKIDKQAFEELKKLREKYGVSIMGEGGEYESFVLNAPHFKKRIVIDEAETLWDGVRGTYNIKDAHLE